MNLTTAALFKEMGYDIEPKNEGVGVPSRKKKVKNKTTQRPNEHHLSVKDIRPLTEGQRQFFYSFESGMNIVAQGSAGTGKTFVATYLALKQLLSGDIEKIIFLRSIVATRDIGFLPGTVWEKSEPYWSLYKDHVTEICENGTAWDVLFKKGQIEFETTSFVRGKTWNNAVIVLDESQNLSAHEIYSALTRVGKGSRVIICGDHKQTDLKKNETGWNYLIRLIDKTSGIFDVVTFTNHDIVRSDFVKQIIIADSELE